MRKTVMDNVCNNSGGSFGRTERTESQSTGVYSRVAAWQPKCYWRLDPTIINTLGM